MKILFYSFLPPVNTVWGNVFTGICYSVHSEGLHPGGSASRGVCIQGGLHPGGSASSWVCIQGVCIQGVSVSSWVCIQGVCIQGGLHPGGLHPLGVCIQGVSVSSWVCIQGCLHVCIQGVSVSSWVCIQGGLYPGGSASRKGWADPPPLSDMANKRAVHILLKSILFNINNKKAFQSNANCPLAGSPQYIMNKVEHVNGVDLHTSPRDR